MVLFCAGASVRGAPADISPLRKQLAVAEEDENKPAIIELSRRILAVTPNDSGLWEKLVGKLFEIEDYDRGAEALDAWQKAVKQPPATIEDFRGDLALKLKEYPEAEKHWLAFVARKPSSADAAATYDKLAELCADQARWADCASYRTQSDRGEGLGDAPRQPRVQPFVAPASMGRRLYRNAQGEQDRQHECGREGMAAAI